MSISPQQKEYPYTNRGPAKLSGELWKDIPGFEGSFQVSNMGRVRSLDRTVLHSRCGIQFVAGRILSQKVKRHYNRFTNDFVIILQVTLMLDNHRYEYGVRRLVYAAFKESGLLKQSTRMAIAKDGDGYNNRLSNIEVMTNSGKQRLIMERGRTALVFAERDHTQFKPTYALWKPVHRCTSRGKILATYPSIMEAVRKEGFGEKGIIAAAKGRVKYYKGFKWRYASRKVLEPFKKAYPLTIRKRQRRPE